MPFRHLEAVHRQMVEKARNLKDQGDIVSADIYRGRAHIVMCSAEQLLEEAVGLYEDAERIMECRDTSG